MAKRSKQSGQRRKTGKTATGRPAARARRDAQVAVAGRADRAAHTSHFRLPRVSKGRRAQFHVDPAADQLFAIVTAITAELSVAFERIRTLEAVLQAGGALRPGAVESHVITDQDLSDRAAEREALIQRVFQVLETYNTRE